MHPNEARHRLAAVLSDTPPADTPATNATAFADLVSEVENTTPQTLAAFAAGAAARAARDRRNAAATPRPSTPVANPIPRSTL